MALLSYEDIVDRYRKNKVREMIPNGSSSHAIVLIDGLLRFARDNKLPVKMVSGTLCKDIYDRFGPLIKEVLEYSKVEVILENASPEELSGNSFYDAVRRSRNGTVRRLASTKGIFHFMLVGDSAYRLETDDALRQASGNFNDPDIGGWLNSMFNSFWHVAVHDVVDGLTLAGVDNLRSSPEASQHN